VLLAAATLTCAFAEKRSNLTAVPYVDLNRYTGRWYEIARYSNRFQRQCVGNVTATYSMLPNGKIEVVNECRKQKRPPRPGEQSLPAALLERDQVCPLNDMTCEYSSTL
jgi:lipocalin